MDILRTLQVVFGIGLVIFVHEGGHFIAARLCKVRVDVFSLGFGPRLFGFRGGSTLYQVAAIPVGGYVKMHGEMPDRSGRPPRGDELWSKSVGQRFFIYSGGVIMNVIFALVAFPILFRAGVPIRPPIIGPPEKGMPAWEAGLEAGTEIVAVQGEKMFDFWHVSATVALADPGPLEFTLRPPGTEELRRVELEPERDPRIGLYRVGVTEGLDEDRTLVVGPDTPARAAGLRTGDQLLGVAGGLSSQTRLEQLRRALLAGEPFTVRVRRGQETVEARVVPEEVERDALLFGFGPLRNQVRGQRPNPDLAALDLTAGERVLEVDGHPVHEPLDWLEALLAAESAPRVTLERPDGSRREATFPHPLDVSAAVEADRDLYLSYDPDSTRIEISPGQGAERAGLRTGDRLMALDGVRVATWQQVLKNAQDMVRRGEPVPVTYERRDDQGVWRRNSVAVTPGRLMAKHYGFDVQGARGIFRTTSVAASLREGVNASWRFLEETWLTLKKMALGRVPTDKVGGIITIGSVSYDWASQGWTKLLFFLCMLSINLAILNVLPIPVLDGGHLMFCLIEMVKGSPVSEKTMGYSQIVGLVVILTLMVFVTYQDVLRLLG